MWSAAEWNKIVQANLPSFGGFLQSYEWGEFQSALGFKTYRFYDESVTGSVIAQVIEQPLPFGQKYYFVPKGPLGNASPDKTLAFLRNKLSDGAFLKIEPASISVGHEAAERHPATSLLTPLEADFELVLAKMKPKTRYNIRLGEKKGVTVRVAGVEAMPEFINLLRETAVRDGFSLHETNRYELMLRTLQSADCQAFLALAEFKGQVLAANLMIDAFGVRTYLHGASSNAERNLMAPYVLHAFLMKDAGEKGFRTYDFWGIAPPTASADHPWAGITRFKMGFGGQIVQMPGTFDVPLKSHLYYAYRLARKLRSLK